MPWHHGAWNDWILRLFPGVSPAHASGHGSWASTTASCWAAREIARATFAFHFEKPDGFNSRRANQSTFSFRRISRRQRRPPACLLSRQCAARGPANDRDPYAQERLQAATQRGRPRRNRADHGADGIDEPARQPPRHRDDRRRDRHHTVYGILRSEAQVDRPRPMVLLYSNSRPRCGLPGRAGHQSSVSTLQLVLTMTDIKDSARWKGETRRIDADMVKEAASSQPGPITMSPAHRTWRRTCGRCWTTTWALTTMTSIARTSPAILKEFGASVRDQVIRTAIS